MYISVLELYINVLSSGDLYTSVAKIDTSRTVANQFFFSCYVLSLLCMSLNITSKDSFAYMHTQMENSDIKSHFVSIFRFKHLSEVKQKVNDLLSLGYCHVL